MTRAPLLALAVTALALAAASPAAALEQDLVAPGDALGSSVAVDGDTLVLGEPADTDGAGAVYVFRRSGDRWTNTAKLTASDRAARDKLGSSVAIDGDTIVAGASGDTFGDVRDVGSAYVFTRTGAAVRTETAKLTASDAIGGDALGSAVAIDGDTIVAGARDHKVGLNARQGAVYTFDRTGLRARTETARLTASDGGANDSLGNSVAIDGDTIVAGAPNDDVGANIDQGTVYTFSRAGAFARTQTATLRPAGGGQLENLGFSVAIDGGTIVTGAAGQLSTASLYTFARTGAPERAETAKLTAANGAGRGLGFAVAIDAGTIVGGAPNEAVGTHADQGSVYTFAGTGARDRHETGRLTAADGSAAAGLGVALAIDGTTIVAGAPAQGFGSVFFSAVPKPLPPPPPAAVKPVLSGLTVSPTGTRISFSLSKPASVTLGVTKAKPGRKVGKRCRTPSRANRGKRHCTRLVPVGSFAVDGKAGSNRISFAGALSLRNRLSRGSYRLTATPTDGAGRRGTARTAEFTVGRR